MAVSIDLFIYRRVNRQYVADGFVGPVVGCRLVYGHKEKGGSGKMKKGFWLLLLSVVFTCATLLQFAFALPSNDLIVHEERPGWMVGQFWKEEATGKIYKINSVERIETDTEIIYQPYVTCFESGDLATVADCND